MEENKFISGVTSADFDKALRGGLDANNGKFAKAEDVTGILALLKQVGHIHHQGRPDIFRKGAQKYGAPDPYARLRYRR